MQPTLKYLSAACASALLMACADVGTRHAPAAAAAQAGPGADRAYLTGRAQHLAGKYALADQSYQGALRIDPSHLKARNGLATLRAEQGDFAAAIALLRELTSGSAASGPGAAYLFSNLGYAYILSGDYAQAVTPLERACILDPLNQRAWRHLGDALAKLGQEERARVMYRQADVLQAHDIKADYALAQRSGVAPIDGAMAHRAAADGLALSELHQGADGMIELRRGSAAPAPLSVAAPPQRAAAADTAPAPPPPALVTQLSDAAPGPERPAAETADSASLEIRNGNGITGMARRLAHSLTGEMGDAGLRVVRLSNQKGFNVAQTRIAYLPGFRAAADRLAERFAHATVEQAAPTQVADVRLVLGRDVMRSKAEARRIIKAALARAAKAA